MRDPLLLTPEEFLSIQPMALSQEELDKLKKVDVQIDFQFAEDLDRELIENSSPWSWRTMKWDDGTWISNYNNDVYEMEYTADEWKIVRLWRHQLKKWIEPVATDYGELRTISRVPYYKVKRLRELRDNPEPEIPAFTKFAFPLIARKFPWFETSTVYQPADRIADGG